MFNSNCSGYIYDELQKKRGWFIISSEDLPYTEQMDHAFRGVHGFGYDELRQSQELRLQVENKRQQDHEKCMQLAAKLDAQAFRG